MLSILGRIKVPGTPWVAMAEPVPAELMEKVKAALRSEDWAGVWRLLPSTRYSVYIDGDVAGSSIQGRTRRPGDRMQPLCILHEKKIHDNFLGTHFCCSYRESVPPFFTASPPYLL